MKALHRKRCCLSRGEAFAAWSALAVAGTLCPAEASVPSCTPLYVEVTLNQRRLPDLYEFCQSGSVFSASSDTLKSLGLSDATLPAVLPGALIPLDNMPGLSARYDMLAASMTLSVPSGLLNARRYETRQTAPPVLSPSLAGILMGYSLYASRTEGDPAVSGWSEFAFTGSDHWSLSDSQQAVWQGTTRRVIHLDTRLVRDFPARAVTLTFGDMLTQGPDWTRTTRMTGVQLARNFSLHPQQSTVPDAAITGQAVLPSVVDIYINDIRQNSRKVDPGPFDIGGMPVRDGVNSVRMVVTDINGKKTVKHFNLYGGQGLLKSGLSEGALEAGVVRRHWGEKDFSVDSNPLLSGSLRHGLTDNLTLESHIEGDRNLVMAGAGFRWVPSATTGMLNASEVQGREGHTGGRSSRLGWQRNSRLFSLSLEEVQSQRHYRDVAWREGVIPARRTQSLFAGLNTQLGTPALGLIRRREMSGDEHRYFSLSWAWSVGGGSLSATFSRQASSVRAQSLALWFTLPLGYTTDMSLSMTDSGRSRQLTTSVSGRAGENDRFNWRVSHSDDGWQAQNSAAEINWQGQEGDVSAGISQQHTSPGATALYASANGSAVILPQGVFLASRVSDAFGLVSTMGVAGIPVQLENNPAGVTDRRGYLLLPDLQSWQRNQVSLDTQSVGEQWTLDGQTTKGLVPARHSGVLAVFDVRENTSVELRLHDTTGRPVAPGGQVTDAQGTVLTQVGFDGMVWLARPQAGEVLTVENGQGYCTTRLDAAQMEQARHEQISMLCR